MTSPRPVFASFAAVLLLAGAGSRPIAGQSTSQATPTDFDVRLDHVYLVVDPASYTAITNSDFLRTQMAALQQRTTTSNGGQTWSGSYLQGRFTYIELFGPGGPFGSEDASGIGLNVAVSGGAEELQRRLLAQGAEAASIQLRTGVRDGREVPWFYSLRRDTPSPSSIARWVMEYHPDFLKWEGTAMPRPDGRLGRRRAPRRAYDPSRAFLDVTGVTVAMADDDREQFRKELTAYGWAVRTDADTAPGGFIADGPDFTLSAVPAVSGRRGIRAMKLQIARAWVGPTEVRLGPRAVLRLHDAATAVWTFW